MRADRLADGLPDALPVCGVSRRGRACSSRGPAVASPRRRSPSAPQPASTSSSRAGPSRSERPRSPSARATPSSRVRACRSASTPSSRRSGPRPGRTPCAPCARAGSSPWRARRRGPVPAELTRIFFNEITVRGVTMGTRDELASCSPSSCGRGSVRRSMDLPGRPGARGVRPPRTGSRSARSCCLMTRRCRRPGSSRRSTRLLDGALRSPHPTAARPPGTPRPRERRGRPPTSSATATECQTLDARGPTTRETSTATLVRYASRRHVPARPARVLYLHGVVGLLLPDADRRVWHGLGAAFYALDLRKYGRSLRRGRLRGTSRTSGPTTRTSGPPLVAIHEDLGTARLASCSWATPRAGSSPPSGRTGTQA